MEELISTPTTFTLGVRISLTIVSSKSSALLTRSLSDSSSTPSSSISLIMHLSSSSVTEGVFSELEYSFETVFFIAVKINESGVNSTIRADSGPAKK